MGSDNQHYVPQFLLKGFTGHKKRLQVFDKHEDRTFATKPHNVAAESGFYDFDLGGETVSIDHGLQKLESRAASIIDRIRSTESLTELDDDSRRVLALFTGVQHLRTANFRERAKDFDRQIRGWLESIGADPENMDGYLPLGDENDVKGFTAMMLVERAEELAGHVINKDWLLTKAPKSHPFLIGDHPVTLSNERDFGFYGNIGFEVPGIEIYVPISTRLSLYFTCKTNGDMVRRGWRDLEKLRRLAPADTEVRDLTARVQPRYRAMVDGTAYETSAENVMRQNSLQVSHAERWVYSATGDWALVRRMISDNPRYRTGGRMVVDWPGKCRY